MDLVYLMLVMHVYRCRPQRTETIANCGLCFVAYIVTSSGSVDYDVTILGSYKNDYLYFILLAPQFSRTHFAIVA